MNVEEIGISLDTESYVPYYEQIVQQIRSLVKKQKLREGEIFCSESDISRYLRISKMPVRQAFQKLRSEGLLIIEKGKRPVIGSGRMAWNFQELRGFSEEMQRRGLVPSAKLLERRTLPADVEVAKALGLPVGKQIYFIKRLRLVNGDPVALVSSYLPPHIFPDIEKQSLENHSLYSLYETTYGLKLHRAEEIIGAVSARDEEAQTLETLPGMPMLLIRETTFDINRTPIEYSRSLLRGDRYTASVISVRKPMGSRSPEKHSANTFTNTRKSR